MVNEDREKGDKTIGKETTFNEDVHDSSAIMEIATNMSQRLAHRLQEKGKKARTVSIVFKTERIGPSYTKSLTLPHSTNDPAQIKRTAEALYLEHLNGLALRLFGVRLSNLEEAEYDQLTFQDLDFKGW